MMHRRTYSKFLGQQIEVVFCYIEIQVSPTLVVYALDSDYARVTAARFGIPAVLTERNWAGLHEVWGDVVGIMSDIPSSGRDALVAEMIRLFTTQHEE